jgi:predicted metalloprotease with PDZ domain
MNSTVSFYESGALVSFLLDLELRRRTANRISLDDAMREMYIRFPASGPGFTTAAMIETLSQLSQSDFAGFFAQHVAGTEPYPFENVLSVVGLELRPRTNSPVAYAGFALKDVEGVPMVRYVLSDGPAWPAGVNANDVVLTVNGAPPTTTGFTKMIEETMKPGALLRLDVRRRGKQHRLEFPLGTKPVPRYDLLPVAAPSPEQKAAWESWLHQPWPAA